MHKGLKYKAKQDTGEPDYHKAADSNIHTLNETQAQASRHTHTGREHHQLNMK